MTEDNFRIGAFDGSYMGNSVTLCHDSMAEEIILDKEELEDLSRLIRVLEVRDRVENATDTYMGEEYEDMEPDRRWEVVFEELLKEYGVET